MKNSYIFSVDKLKGEYKTCFDAVETYRYTHLLDAERLEEQMMELLDQVLAAQEEGVPAKKIFGNDMERFCEKFFCDYGVKDRLFSVLMYFKVLAWSALFFTGFGLISGLVTGEFHASIKTDLNDIIIVMWCTLVMDAIMYFIIRPIAERLPKVSSGIWITIFIVITLVVSFCFATFLPKKEIEISIWLIISVIILFLLVKCGIKAYKNIKQCGSIKGPNKDSVKFVDLVNDEVDRCFPFELYKTFTRKNARLKKKGKTPMTTEQFFAKLDKKYNDKFIKTYNILIFGGLTFVVLVHDFITSNEGIAYKILFSILLIVIEFFIGRLFYNSEMSASRRYMLMKQDMEEKGLDFATYMEQIKTEE